jgi:arylsulfatase A-like enzyme
MPKRPNILLILADQMRADCLGAVNPAIRTPALDQIAREGVLFTRAYAPTPVCLPCRASLVSGTYPSSNRATHNHAPLARGSVPFLPEILARAGYYTHIIGKSHLTSCHDPASFESAPNIHNRRFFRNWHGPWYGFERADISIGHTTELHACGMHYGVWLEERGVDASRFFGRTAYEAYGAWDLPEEHHSSRWTADVTIDAIRRAAGEGRPFYIWANFQDPHNPCMVPRPWAGMYSPDDVPRFGFKPGEPECFAGKPPFYTEILGQPGPYRARPSDPGLKGAGNVSRLDWTAREVRENAACYYGMVSLMDAHVGRVMAALDEMGLRDDTLVVFSADHGDMLGDHGLWWKSLTCYEEMMRVPMIVSRPGTLPRGARSEAIQNLVDLPATFLRAAGLEPPVEYEGADELPSWLDPSRAVREDTVVEERPYDTDFNMRVLVTPTHKLAFYAHRDYGELYDVEADPDQVRNLWADPACRDLRERLVMRLLSLEMNRRRPRLTQSEANARW